jgi:hypothetical protein
VARRICRNLAPNDVDIRYRLSRKGPEPFELSEAWLVRPCKILSECEPATTAVSGHKKSGDLLPLFQFAEDATDRGGPVTTRVEERHYQIDTRAGLRDGRCLRVSGTSVRPKSIPKWFVCEIDVNELVRHATPSSQEGMVPPTPTPKLSGISLLDE